MGGVKPIGSVTPPSDLRLRLQTNRIVKQFVLVGGLLLSKSRNFF